MAPWGYGNPTWYHRQAMIRPHTIQQQSHLPSHFPNVPWPRKPTQALTVTINRLHETIDYDMIRVPSPSQPTKETALADGLSYIELLRNGELPQDTRGLGIQEITKRLATIIPGSHFRAAGVPASAIRLVHFFGQTPSHEQFLNATRTYIAELVLRTGVRQAGASQITLSNIEDKGQETESQILTERALVRMGQWIDVWLDGSIQDEDCETFENCLDLPNRAAHA